MVVGIVDEHGSSVISCGDLDNGTDRQADGDTVFSIQSSSYTFFCLLLEDMVERGEMKPDDPVEKYLPPSVKMPTYNGKQITLRHLAKETSGLRPSLGDAIDPERADAPFEGFTAEKFYALVSNYRLTAAPGTTHMHPSLDRGVLNLAMARKDGTDFESLLIARVLRPLNMNDTRLSLTPELESRFAPEHSKLGCTMPRWREGDFVPLAGIYSTANDLLKMLSACGITSSRLRPLWDNTVANFAKLAAVVGRTKPWCTWMGCRYRPGTGSTRRDSWACHRRPLKWARMRSRRPRSPPERFPPSMGTRNRDSSRFRLVRVVLAFEAICPTRPMRYSG